MKINEHKKAQQNIIVVYKQLKKNRRILIGEGEAFV
jgi:hypothetical protein